jgi:SSS family solute:Na+ symporter
MSIVFIALIALSLLVALLSGRGGAHQKPEDFFVASGRFGSVLFFFLAVGETYSIATILGVPAGVFAHGTGFLAWFLGYILLAFPVGYFLYPCIWRAGRRTCRTCSAAISTAVRSNSPSPSTRSSSWCRWG